MMQTRRYGRSRWLVVAATVAVLTLAQVALAAEFSADLTVSGKAMSGAGKIYVKGASLRTEMAQGQQKQIMILNATKKMMWVVDPAAKTYWGNSVSDKDLVKQADALKGKMPAEMGPMSKPKRVGTETVNGYVCDKLLSEGKQTKATVWFSKKLGFPVKSEVTGPRGGVMRQEFKNIKQGPQAASLFEPPKGYQQVTSPMQGMRGGMQGRRGGTGRMGRRGGR